MDLFLTTDNQYMVGAVNDNLPPITYQKKKTAEQVITDNGIINFDTKAFNSKVGVITNLASNLIAMLYSCDKDSPEYKEIRKRIDILRLYQGICIDSAKGDVYVPPPKYWSKKQPYLEGEGHEEENTNIAFNNRICCDKKAYFFGYVYYKLMREQKAHKMNYRRMCYYKYGCKIDDLFTKKDKTDSEKQFIKDYYRHMPLIQNNCTMNVLARYAEDVEFENRWKKPDKPFDYHCMMSSDNVELDEKVLAKVNGVLKSYFKQSFHLAAINESGQKADYNPFAYDEGTTNNERVIILREHEELLFQACSNRKLLADCLVYLLYTKYKSKPRTILWGEIGNEIADNLKRRNKKAIVPIISDEGIEYMGKHYVLKEFDVE